MIRLSDLAGRPRVVAMFFASCDGACSITLEHLREIEASLPASVRDRAGFVLVTLDPERDTARNLAAYRSERRLPASRWTLLRGTPEGTSRLATALRTRFTRNSPRGIAHTSEITVIDASGKVVDSQSGTHPELDRIIHAMGEPPASARAE